MIIRILFIFCIVQSTFGQIQDSIKKKYTFSQFELSVPLSINPNRGKTEYDGQKQNFFIPDGISTKMGYGIHFNKWLLLSAHTGLDWKIKPKLVSVPLYGQLSLAPLIGEEVRLLLQAGYGQSFALGRGKLSGNYYKFRLGIGSEELSIFIDASLYGFYVYQVPMGSFSIGVTVLNFD